MKAIHQVTLLLVVFCLPIVVLPFAYAEKASEPEKIDINTADAWTLEYVLHGVGKKKAAAIIEFREKNGPFKSIYELEKVYGIGKKTILKNMEKMIVILPEQPEQPSEAEGLQTGEPTASTQAPQDVPATDNATNPQAQDTPPATDNAAETPAVTDKPASQPTDK